MKPTKHTPGPWIIQPAQKGKLGGIEVTTNKQWLDRELICMMPHGPGQLQAMNNAQLIASAPALLAALQNLLAIAEKQLDQGANHDGITNANVLAEARKAITDATE